MLLFRKSASDVVKFGEETKLVDAICCFLMFIGDLSEGVFAFLRPPVNMPGILFGLFPPRQELINPFQIIHSSRVVVDLESILCPEA